MTKLIVTIAKTTQGFVTSLSIEGNANEWALKQLKKNQAKALRIADSDELYTGEENTHFYQHQLEKFLAKFDGLKNVTIVEVA